MKSTYEAYYEAPQAIKDIVDSGIIGDLIESILVDTQFLNLKSKVIITSTKFFLSSITPGDFVLELQDNGIAEPIIQTLLKENKRLLEESLHGISENMNSISSEIAELEKSLEPNTETTYTSTQAAILQEGRSAPTNTPASTLRNPNPTATPARWDTEQ